MCVSVCLSVRSHNSKTIRWNYTFLQLAVARSSSGGVAILYALPVFADDVMFSRNGPVVRHVCIPMWRWNTTSITVEIPTKSCSAIKTSEYLSWVARRGRNLLSTISLFSKRRSIAYDSSELRSLAVVRVGLICSFPGRRCTQ